MNSVEEERRLKLQALLDDALIIYKLNCRCGGKHETIIPGKDPFNPYDPLALVEDFIFPATK